MRKLIVPAVLALAMAAEPAAAQVVRGGAPIPAPGAHGGNFGGRPGFSGGQRVNAPAPPPAPNRPMPPRGGAGNWQGGPGATMPPRGNAHQGQPPRNRWGGHVGGRWYAGGQAPGGWGGYRQMRRGHHLPRYWLNGSFGIPDYLAFGLAAPPYGYHWTRYYDDAVLVDDRGAVWDSVGGIGWDEAEYGYDDGYGYGYDESYAGAGYAQPIRSVDPTAYYTPPYPAPGYAPAPGVQVQSYVAGGYGYGYGYGYAPATTTVVVTSAPVTTTTTVTEEVIEESVTTTSYVRKPARVVRKRAPVRKPRPKVKVRCCVCGCR